MGGLPSVKDWVPPADKNTSAGIKLPREKPNNFAIVNGGNPNAGNANQNPRQQNAVGR